VARTTTERGYGYAHQQARQQWAPRVATGTVPCTRCGRPIKPGTPWHLDHNDNRAGYRGPSHATCNTSTGGTKGALAGHAKRATTTREW
jgi:hypothetical protein